MVRSAAYERGAVDAVERFGVRTAASRSSQHHLGRMSDGPTHLGASRFAKALEEDVPAARAAPTPNRRLDRPTLWGNPSSPESGGVSNFDTGLRYGGV